VVQPGIHAHLVEVLLALLAVQQIFVLLVHLSEADCAIRIVLQVNLLVVFAVLHAAAQAVGQLLVEHLVSCRGKLGSCGAKVIENLFILSHLSDDEEDVFAGLLLHAEVDASALDSR
jgi:hypothetical protein